MARTKQTARISTIVPRITFKINETKSKPSTSEDMDTTEDEFSKCCSICLDVMKDQMIGKVNFCEHLFCASCIIEWLNINSICPLDRGRPRALLVFKNIKRVSGLQMCKSVILYHVNCIVCHMIIRDDEYVSCGSCNAEFHINCIASSVENMKAYDRYTCPGCELIPIHTRKCDCLRCHNDDKCDCHVSQSARTQPFVRLSSQQMLISDSDSDSNYDCNSSDSDSNYDCNSSDSDYNYDYNSSGSDSG